MSSLADISNGDIRELLGTRGISRSLVNLQDGTATYDTVTEPDAIMSFMVNGNIRTNADLTNKAVATLAALQNPITGQDGYYQQPINTTVYYVLCVNAAGTFYCIQGTYAGQVINRAGRNGVGDGSIPDIVVKSTYAPFAVLKVVNGATAVFIPATTNWDATGVDAYAAPVSVLPRSASDLTFVIGAA